VSDQPENQPGPPDPQQQQPSGASGASNPFRDDQPVVGQYQHQPVTARVPDRVARAVYSTGQLILDSPKEFVIDFLNALTRPFQIVSRVVLAPATMAEFAQAMRMNLEKYTQTFGPPPPLVPPPNPHRPSIQEIYENFKIADDMLAGAYANSIMIGHSQTEFFLDFIAGFSPTSSVAARVLIAAPHVPRFLNTVNTSVQQYQARYMRRDPDQPPPSAPSGNG
jgi:hypothetical protein